MANARMVIPGCSSINLEGKQLRPDGEGVFEIPGQHVDHVREVYGGRDLPPRAARSEGSGEKGKSGDGSKDKGGSSEGSGEKK